MAAPRKKLLKALASCIESMCLGGALIDMTGAIDESLRCDHKIWHFLHDDVKEILKNGLGYIEP